MIKIRNKNSTPQTNKFWIAFSTFAFCILNFITAEAAQKITIIYTGQTHAALYPCHCPKDPDGGIARRATAIKQLRKKNPHLILLDAGGFFGGGIFDEYTQNRDLDSQRSRVNLKAMEVMGYDAAAISDEEFNFGYQFLKEGIDNTKIDFLSCNIELDKLKRFTILEVDGVRIGIIAIANPPSSEATHKLEVRDAGAAVTESVNRLKKLGAHIIVLLSSLDKTNMMTLLNTVEGIDVLINASSKVQDIPESTTLGSVVMLNSFWQGRALGELTLDIENGKVKSWSNRKIRLSSEIADDKGILRILPPCFSNSDCLKKGYLGSCTNAGTMRAKCSFVAAKTVNLTVITTKDRAPSENKVIFDFLEKQFPGLKVTYLHYPQTKAVNLIKDLDIKSLPAYLLGKEADKESGFSVFRDNLEQKGQYYLLSNRVSGISYFLDRERLQGKIDLFISLYYPNAAGLLQAVKEFNPALHFLLIPAHNRLYTSKGDPETEEYLRSVCIEEYYPQKFWDYVSCRAQNIYSSWWEDCLRGAESSRVRSCARSEEGKKLLDMNMKLGAELGIISGPAYLVSNQEVYGSGEDIPSRDEFRKIFKKYKK